MFNSFCPHGLQHARRPSLSPWVCSNSCPLSQWWHPTISSSVTLFSSCPQSFPLSESFPMNRLFASGSQSIGASVSVLLMNIQGWFPLVLTGLISLLSTGLSGVFSSTTVWKHQFFSTLGIIEMLVLSWTHDALGGFHAFALVVLPPGMAVTPTPFYSNLYVTPTVSLRLRVQTLPPPASLPIATPSAMPKLLILVCSPALLYIYLCPLPLEIILFLCIFRCLISAEIASYSCSALSTGPGTT